MTDLAQFLRDRAAEHGERPFLRGMGARHTFRSFDERTDRLAAGLAATGIGPGDVVSVMLPNRPEFLEAWWAILKAGAVFGPVNPQLTASEAGYVIGHSRAVAVVCDSARAEVLAGYEGDLPQPGRVIDVDAGDLDALATGDAPVPDVRRDPDDLAALLYTSGTTGRPKGAMLSHANVLADAWMTAEVAPLTAGERVGLVLPLFHANAQIVTTLVPMLVGCEVVLWGPFSPRTFWAEAAEERPVGISAVPTLLSALLHAPGAEEAAGTTLKYVMCGAAPLSRDLLDAFQDRFGIRVLEGYGLTEGTCVSSCNPYYGPRKAGSIGLPLRGQQMEVRGPSGERAAPGERGEIVVRGPNVMLGYLDDAEATAETLVDGWLRTGDIGVEDEDGYFSVVDRTKDMIIRSGENIYPREIEEVLHAHPDVTECAVLGVPDDHRGEEVLAVVASARAGADLDPEEVREFAALHLARFKVPRYVEVVDELPKTSTGKIAKPPLRERFGAARA